MKESKYASLIIFLIICALEALSTYFLYQMPIKKLYVDGILLFFCILEGYYLVTLFIKHRSGILKIIKKYL